MERMRLARSSTVSNAVLQCKHYHKFRHHSYDITANKSDDLYLVIFIASYCMYPLPLPCETWGIDGEERMYTSAGAVSLARLILRVYFL